MSNALALIEPTQYELMGKLAKVAAMSGYSKQNEVQAMFIMLKGFELGISPMQALEGIQVIQGKTTVSPQLMLALINRSGLMEDLQMDGDAKAYTVTMKRVGRSAHTETFTIDNAKSMGLAGKDNWQKQPAVMLKWRAVSACARVVFPDVIQGMYTPEEMGAEVSEDSSGDIVIEQAPLSVLPPPAVDTSTGEIVEGSIVENAPQDAQEGRTEAIEASSTPTSQPPQTDAQTAKSRFGNANGGKSSITYPATSYRNGDNIYKVKAQIQDLYLENGKPNAFHMNGSIDKLEAAGTLDPKTHTVEQAVKIIRDYKAAQKAAEEAQS